RSRRRSLVPSTVVELAGDLVVAAVAAVVGGVLALRLGQPALVGYLLAGLIVGPHAVALIRSPDHVDALARIGVVLLLFAIGAELDFRALTPVWRVAVFGGSLQIITTVGLVFAVGTVLGIGPASGLFLGLLAALSSTMAALKILGERGETDTLHGRICLGILLV